MDELKGIVIPPKPHLLMDIEAAKGRMGKVAEAIAKDPSIAAATLKCANAPYYRRAVPVTSIQRAVVMLGETNIIHLVRGLILKTALKGELPSNWFEWYWRSATDVAVLSSSIWQSLMFPPDDTSYALGLFHNSGMPLMAQRFANYIDNIVPTWQSIQTHLADAERAQYGVSHCEAGRMVAKQWSLAPEIVSAIEHHHCPVDQLPSTLPDTIVTYIAILQWANYLNREFHSAGQLDHSPEWQHQAKPILEFFGLTPDAWQEISLDGLSDLSDQHLYEEIGETVFNDHSWISLPDDCYGSDNQDSGDQTGQLGRA